MQSFNYLSRVGLHYTPSTRAQARLAGVRLSRGRGHHHQSLSGERLCNIFHPAFFCQRVFSSNCSPPPSFSSVYNTTPRRRKKTCQSQIGGEGSLSHGRGKSWVSPSSCQQRTHYLFNSRRLCRHGGKTSRGKLLHLYHYRNCCYIIVPPEQLPLSVAGGKFGFSTHKTMTHAAAVAVCVDAPQQRSGI